MTHDSFAASPVCRGISSRVRIFALSVAALWSCFAVNGVAAGDEPQDATQRQLHFKGYPDAPSFQVLPRRDDLFFYPCSQCHEFMEASDTIRELDSPHDIELDHGSGRLWCIQCHSMDERDMLWTMLKEPVDFDEAYIVCGGCHANRQRDWYYGSHGKRLEVWQGERVLYNCTHCHDAHSPSIKPRAPVAAPPVRAGMERPDGEVHRPESVWQRHEAVQQGGTAGEH